MPKIIPPSKDVLDQMRQFADEGEYTTLIRGSDRPQDINSLRRGVAVGKSETTDQSSRPPLMRTEKNYRGKKTVEGRKQHSVASYDPPSRYTSWVGGDSLARAKEWADGTLFRGTFPNRNVHFGSPKENEFLVESGARAIRMEVSEDRGQTFQEIPSEMLAEMQDPITFGVCKKAAALWKKRFFIN
jgi:hypothetical protein